MVRVIVSFIQPNRENIEENKGENKTDGGHVIIYNNKGERFLDISSERVKVWKRNVNPNNPSQINWSNSKIKNDNGQVERIAQWILDYFNIGG